MKDIFLKLMFNILKNYMNFIMILPFLPQGMKVENFEKLVTNLHDKTEFFIHIRNLKQALNQRLILKKVQRGIKFNQNAWLKLYIDMNTKLREKAKNNFDKDFSKLINYAVFGKTMKNVRKHGNIKLVARERRRNYLVAEPNYHTTKFILGKFISNRNKKTSNAFE